MTYDDYLLGILGVPSLDKRAIAQNTNISLSSSLDYVLTHFIL